MAVTTAASKSNPPTEEWDEDRIEASLEQLKEMHIQLRELRSTIPDMIKPLTSNHQSPETLFQDFSSAATTATDNVKSFTAYMRSDSAKGVLQHAAASRKMKAEGLQPWRVADHPDWLDRSTESTEKGEVVIEAAGPDNASPQEMNRAGLDNDLPKVLESFKKAHPEISVEHDEKEKRTLVRLSPPSSLPFVIVQGVDASGQPTYRATCKPAMKIFSNLTRSLASAPPTGDIVYLTEMLASYQDLMSKECKKCDRLLSPNARYPIIRKRIRIKKPEGQTETSWDAYHDDCV